MRLLSIILIIQVVYNINFAQPQFKVWNNQDPNTNLHTFGQAMNFPTLRIADDFGPRQITTNGVYSEYRWHGGIDYNSQAGDADLGDLILALEEGNISRYSQMLTGPKSVLIEANGAGGHHLRYVHVFAGGALINFPNGLLTGGCLLKAMDSPNHDLSVNGGRKWAIIVMDNGTYTAYGPVPPNAPGYVTFNDENGMTHTLEVENHVPLGAGFAPLGTSPMVPAHLHLEILTQTNDNGNQIPAGDDEFVKDPLQLYNHDVPDYELKFMQQNDISNGMVLSYPGNINSTIQVHAELDNQDNNQIPNRYDVVMNLDNLDILIKSRDQTTFQLVQGPYHESRFSHGARIGQNNIRMPFSLTNTETGQWDRTHMQPFAYAGLTGQNVHHPRDDYYFADFTTRIHQNDPMDGNNTPTQIANCNEESRYPDNLYQIKISATDVSGTIHEGPKDANGLLTPLEFVLDNFRPYIKKATVRVSSFILYSEEWECDNGCITFTDDHLSESISGELIKLVGYDVIINTSEPLAECFISIENYNIMDIPMIPDPSLPEGTGFTFHVPGNLIGDNEEVIVFSFEGEDLNGNTLVAFEPSHDNGCLEIPTRVENNNWFNPDNLPFGADIIHRFCLGCAMTDFTSDNEIGRTSKGSCETQVNIIADEINLSADVTNPTFNANCSNGMIDLHINGGFPPYDVTWKRVIFNYPYPPLYIVVQQSLNIQGTNDGEDLNNAIPGSYTVEVNDGLCGTVTRRYELKCECSDDCKLDAVVQPASCGAGGSIIASIDCDESGHNPFTIKWSDLEPSQLQRLSRINLSPGTYCLEVSDRDNCIYEMCWEVSESVIEVEVELVDKKDVSLCRGETGTTNCDGSLTISVPPGATIDWQNIPNPSETFSNIVTDLCPGTYTVEVYIGGCVITKSYIIGCCTLLDDIDAEYTPPISITGDANSGKKTITLSVMGGGAKIYYNWTGPNGFTAHTKHITNLVPGIYCVRAFDGCSEDEECFEIVDCNAKPMSISASIENTCDEIAVGSITLIISGGASPYNAVWSNGQTGLTINNLAAGEYCVRVSDKHKCEEDIQCFNVTSSPGTVFTTTIPYCTRTILCNGVPYTSYYEYIQWLDCNILYSTCPTTQETLWQNLGWAGIFVQSCQLIGICQDGSFEVLQYGQTIPGPHLVPDGGCESGYTCFSSLCYFQGIGYLSNSSDQGFCAEPDYVEDPINCPVGFCRVNIYCGLTLMGFYCQELERVCQIFLDNPDEESENRANSFDTGLIQPVELAKIPNHFFDYKIRDTVNSITFPIVNNTELDIDLYPVPTSEMIILDSKGKNLGKITIHIFNVFGEMVYTSKIDFSNGNTRLSINISDLLQGVYFISLIDDHNRSVVHKAMKM